MRIALFGGSFDPPHLGHLEMIKKTLESNLVDQVWVVPSFQNPWKKESASPKDRLAMSELLVDDYLFSSKVKVSNLEIERRGKSYTIDTVKELKKKYPNNQFYFLIGSDRIKDLSKWHKAEELFLEIGFISLPRTKISSSIIREKIKLKKSIVQLVPKRIEKYIKDSGLYV